VGRAPAILAIELSVFNKFLYPAQILANHYLAHVIFRMAILRPVAPLNITITHIPLSLLIAVRISFSSPARSSFLLPRPLELPELLLYHISRKRMLPSFSVHRIRTPYISPPNVFF